MAQSSIFAVVSCVVCCLTKSACPGGWRGHCFVLGYCSVKSGACVKLGWCARFTAHAHCPVVKAHIKEGRTTTGFGALS